MTDPKKHYESFVHGNGIETTENRLVVTCNLKPNGWLPSKSKISTFFKELKQDLESHNIIFKMLIIIQNTPCLKNFEISICMKKYNQ